MAFCRLAHAPRGAVDPQARLAQLVRARVGAEALEGRFGLNITPRVAVVAGAMASLVLADELLASGHIHPTRLDLPAPAVARESRG